MSPLPRRLEGRPGLVFALGGGGFALLYVLTRPVGGFASFFGVDRPAVFAARFW